MLRKHPTFPCTRPAEYRRSKIYAPSSIAALLAQSSGWRFIPARSIQWWSLANSASEDVPEFVSILHPEHPMTVVVRETRETTIRCELTRGAGHASVATGQPFLDHMLVVFARYSGLDVKLQATGDLPHHLIEDVAICLGAAITGLLPATAARYGDRTVPMDEALVHC